VVCYCTLGEEHKLQVHGNQELRKIRIFGPRRDEVRNILCHITLNFVIYTGRVLLLG
jgi:hypothetical protein